MKISPLMIHNAASLKQVVSTTATMATGVTQAPYTTKTTVPESSPSFGSPTTVTSFVVPLDSKNHLPLPMATIEASSTAPPTVPITRATSGGEAAIGDFLSDVNDYIRQSHTSTLQQPPLYVDEPKKTPNDGNGYFSSFYGMKGLQLDVLKSSLVSWTTPESANNVQQVQEDTEAKQKTEQIAHGATTITTTGNRGQFSTFHGMRGWQMQILMSLSSKLVPN